jgi:hypothetical protein
MRKTSFEKLVFVANKTSSSGKRERKKRKKVW